MGPLEAGFRCPERQLIFDPGFRTVACDGRGALSMGYHFAFCIAVVGCDVFFASSRARADTCNSIDLMQVCRTRTGGVDSKMYRYI